MRRPLPLLLVLLALHVPLAVAGEEGAAAAPVLDTAKLERAEKLLGEGRYEAALELFDALAAAGPEEGRVEWGAGRALKALGRHGAAVDRLVHAWKLLGEEHDDVLYDLGEALHLQGRQAVWEQDYETAGYALLDARRMFEQAAELRAGSAAADAWLGAARAERERGEAGEAALLLERALAADDSHVATLVETASLRFGDIQAATQAGDAEGAQRARAACRELYETAHRLDPTDGYALNGLGWVALSAGDEEEAVRRFHQSLLADPTLLDSHDNLEQLLSGSKEERTRLIELLDQVVAAAARHGDGATRTRARALALYRRGLAKAAVRDVAGQDHDLAEAARLEPSFAPSCALQRARGLYSDNRYEEAAAALLGMVRDDLPTLLEAVAGEKAPRDVALMARSLADRCYRDNDLEGARDLCRLAAEILVDSANDWNNYALFARDTGCFEESYAAYERAIALEGDNPSFLNDAALILHYHLHRDLEHAAGMYERAIEEAKRVLADPGADSFAKDNATVALRDAGNNLALLRAGKTSRRGQR